MRRRFLILPVLFLLFALFSLSVGAVGEEEETSAPGGESVDALLEEFRTLLPEGFSPDVTDPDAIGEAVGVRAFFAAVLSAARGSSDDVLSFFFLLMGAALFFAVAGTLRTGIAGSLGEITEAAICAVLSVAVFEKLRTVTETTAAGLSEAGRFFGGLFPFLGTVTLAGGGTSLAASQALTMELTLSVLTALTDGVLLPLTGAMFALALLGTVDGAGGSLSGLTDSFRRAFLWLLGIVTAVFAASLSLQSVIAAATDSAAMRAAKFAASDLIPIVGGTVSGALSAAASGLFYVKSVVGVSGIAALLFLVLPYLVPLLLLRAAFGIAIGFLSFTGAKVGERVFAAFRSALDTLIALTSLSLLLYLFEIVCFMKGGVAIG
ncbi:MAG TPA: hypothetical protein DDY70_06230 [Clostridiales bacterium]|nr:hypothetical protein [Clostridiales bacterium]